MDSVNNSATTTKKPLVKRRKFFFLFGAAAVGLVALSRSPLKLISSLAGSKQARNDSDSSSAKSKQGIIVRENPYAVKREKGSRLNG
jgi:hypothetical protein